MALCMETWAESYGNTQFNDYHCFEKIRSTRHVRAPRASGGLTVLVKFNVLQKYEVKQIYCDKEEVIHVQLKDKISGFVINIIGTYIPPDSSVFGQYNDAIFEHLVNMIYELCDDDLTVIMGDINGRVGSKSDFIEGIDDISPRVAIDEVINDQGKSLIAFLLQTNMCILNGRVDPLMDNFTSISHRGKAVVDYILVPQCQLPYITSFSVNTMSDLTDKYDLPQETSRVSDHSILSCTIVTRDMDTEKVDDTTDNIATCSTLSEAIDPNVDNAYPKPANRYKKKKLPNHFMCSNENVTDCLDIIDRLIKEKQTVEKLDKLYDDVVKMYHDEMSKFLQVIRQTPKSKRAITHTKNPYWDDELSSQWKIFHDAEKVYLKTSRKSPGHDRAKQDFLKSQKTFDKLLRNKKRSYQRRKMYELEEVNISDPNKFWECIKKLGPRKSSAIPWEIYDDKHEIVTDHRHVLD